MLVRIFPLLAACALMWSEDDSKLVSRLQTLERLMRTVQQEHAYPIEREALWNGALHGMLSGLDGASRYLTADEVALHGASQAAHWLGTGLEWRLDPARNLALVTRVIPGSPAARAQLAPGDHLLSVAGLPLASYAPEQLRKRMLAQEPLALTWLRPEGGEGSATLERVELPPDGLDAQRMLNQRIGYIRIGRFRDGPRESSTTITGSAFRKALDQLQQHNMEALMLDLRGCAGGNMQAGVEVADCFLHGGTGEGRIICQVSARNPARAATYVARSTTTYPDWPLVVLMDQETASTAEMVAAALQGHRRATLLGTSTTGKDTVQELLLLEDGSGLLLTVGVLRGPNDLTWGGTGLKPDVARPSNPAQVAAALRAELAGNQASADQDALILTASAMLTSVLIDRTH